MKIAVILLFFALFSLQPVASVAADPGTGGASFAVPGGPRAQFGAQTGSLDGFDGTDRLASPSDGWNCGTYHIKNQDGWLGDMGFYASDLRAALTPSESKTWTFYVWAVPGTTPSDRWFTGSLWTSDPANLNAVLEYIQKPAGIDGGPAVGTTWNAGLDILLPFYSTSDGQTGYGFRLTLTMVPEPSSLLALAGGMAGLGGLALRRKRS